MVNRMRDGWIFKSMERETEGVCDGWNERWRQCEVVGMRDVGNMRINEFNERVCGV